MSFPSVPTFTLGTIICTSIAALAAEVPPFVWLEGEAPTAINVRVREEGVGHPHFLSERQWLRVGIEAESVEKDAPKDAPKVTMRKRIPSRAVPPATLRCSNIPSSSPAP